MPSDVSEVRKAKLKQHLQDPIMARRIKETILDVKVNMKLKCTFLMHLCIFHNISVEMSLFLHLFVYLILYFMLNSAKAIVLLRHFVINFRKIKTSPHDWRISLGIWELLSCFTDHAI